MAIGFLALTGIVILAGMVITLSQIMQRLNSADQDNVVMAAPAEPTTTTLASAGQSSSKSYPVIGRAEPDRLLLPQGAVVQQLVPNGGGVYLLVNVPNEGQRIVILDARTGNIRRDIHVENGGK